MRVWNGLIGVVVGGLIAGGCATVSMAQSGVPHGGALEHPVDVQLIQSGEKCLVRYDKVIPDPVRPYGPRLDKVRWEIANSCTASVHVRIDFAKSGATEQPADHPFETSCNREKDVPSGQVKNITCKLRNGDSHTYKYRIMIGGTTILDPEVEVWN